SATASLGPREPVVILAVEHPRPVPAATASPTNLLHALPPAENDREAPGAPPAEFQKMMKGLLKRCGRS
ncbi:flagellar biosynthetic protein FliO, partial [Salmonella enterica]|uniref:flagellar biosynthetic protein FliO n=1 Tax=Salmonella enterica TaxID=28901 RepID=UPI003EDC95D7